MLDDVIETIRATTAGSPYEGRLFLVGGLLRDRALGLPPEEDVDIVCLDSALSVAELVYARGAADHQPVVYPRFGTAMVGVRGVNVEFATARRESYSPDSRKPSVQPATLQEDVIRRDFTVNTLLENLHTGEALDLTGKAMADLKARTIRTPADPVATFQDDPLRMLRAVRFAAKLNFRIAPAVWKAILRCGDRLEIISRERIRDELSKTLLISRVCGGPEQDSATGATCGLEMLRESGLLVRFAPELTVMYGVTQNIYHIYDVWTHTMKALDHLPEDADLILRLAVLFHDTGKPATRTVDEEGCVHFYGHQRVSSDIAWRVMRRLKYPNGMIEKVVRLVGLHMRIGEYKPQWSDSAVRRMVRETGGDLERLFIISDADKAACNPEYHYLDSRDVRQRVEAVQQDVDYTRVESPLDGLEIMETAGIGPGRRVGELKALLVNEILEGRLAPGDKETARRVVREAPEE